MLVITAEIDERVRWRLVKVDSVEFDEYLRHVIAPGHSPTFVLTEGFSSLFSVTHRFSYSSTWLAASISIVPI